jgi:hypothetical protein
LSELSVGNRVLILGYRYAEQGQSSANRLDTGAGHGKGYRFLVISITAGQAANRHDFNLGT